jgi:hypothetical protein
MLTVLGAEWCHGCLAIRKRLLAKNIDHEFIRVPPGAAGWDLVEKLTGRRAIPAVFYRFETLKEFNQSIDALDLPERELTEEELDELEP